jgi:glutamate-1-semialdehyde 2,1-aminomutase
MNVLNPIGHTVMSGTYTGHIPAVLGALACQHEIAKPGFYDNINALADHLYSGITELFHITGVPGILQGVGARFSIFFGITEPVTNYSQAVKCDREMEIKFLLGCIDRGLYLHDNGHKVPMHQGYSSQHTMEDINEALNIIEDVFKELHK